jgi:hypothetical protein
VAPGRSDKIVSTILPSGSSLTVPGRGLLVIKVNLFSGLRRQIKCSGKAGRRFLLSLRSDDRIFERRRDAFFQQSPGHFIAWKVLEYVNKIDRVFTKLPVVPSCTFSDAPAWFPEAECCQIDQCGCGIAGCVEHSSLKSGARAGRCLR